MRHAVLKDLAELETRFGPSAGLLRRVEIHADAVGLRETARQARLRRVDLVPRTARDHVVLGRMLLASRLPRDAVKHFDLALDLQPENLWPHFYKGQCAFELGDHREAVASFSVCIGLAPKSARCYYNRERSYVASGQPERALHDFDRALQLEPTLTIALKERERLRVR